MTLQFLLDVIKWKSHILLDGHHITHKCWSLFMRGHSFMWVCVYLCIKHFQKLNQFTQLNLNPAYETSVLSDLLNIINLGLYETFNGRNQDKKAHDKNTALIFLHRLWFRLQLYCYCECDVGFSTAVDIMPCGGFRDHMD